MSSAAIATVIKMIESLPEKAQDRVVEHLRVYLENLLDECHWDAQFEKSQAKLIAAAKRAKQQIADGQAMPMDLN